MGRAYSRSLGVVLGACVVAVAACSSSAPPADEALPEPGPATPKPTPTTPGPETDAGLPDAPPACQTVAPTHRCGLDPQCGCANTETCDVTNEASGATSCVTAGGATVGRPCTQTGDCLAGLTCQFGACRPYCKTPRTKCVVAGTDLCVEILGADQKPITNKSVCTIACDPRVPAGACGTNACHWFDTYYAPSKVSDCNFGGTVAAQAACQFTSDCLPGLACINHPSRGFECEKWCRIGQVPSDCGNDPKLKCKDVFGAAAPVINGVSEGVCQN
ncbi:MAG TPA: hypothetical protein VLT33_34275 [Labilithrix sp.]|nr:hypothetical protein [Labilithrix sp.]